MSLSIEPVDGWPFPNITTDYQQGGEVWREVSAWRGDDGEDFYDYMLNVLPPKGWSKGAFMVGEAAAHDPDGMVVYTAVARIGEHIFARDVRLDEYRAKVQELHAAIAAGVA